MSCLLGILWPSPLRAAAPVVDSFTATPASAAPAGIVTLTVTAHDPDCPGTCSSGCGQTIRADLTLWSASGGTFTATSNGTTGSPYTASADWQAPAAEGTYTLTVSISDSATFMCGGRQSATAALAVQVTTSTNRPPVVQSVTASPGQLYPSQKSNLSCTASDPDGDALSYAWSADGGNVSTTGATSAVFEAGAPGIYTVTCSVTDPGGATASAASRISVSDAFAERSLSSGLVTPQRLAVDSMGDLYVVDPASGGLAVINLFSGDLVYRIPAAGVASVALDWQDRLLVGGSVGARILDRRGEVVLRLDPGEPLGAISDVAVDPVNRRYAVLHEDAGSVVVYEGSGSRLAAFGSTGDDPGQLKKPRGLAIAPGGEVVVADTGHGKIKTFTPAGLLLNAVGDLGGSAGQFVQLDDVAVDGSGIVYASDAFQAWVQTFNPDGTLREVLGTYGDRLGQFKTPAGLAPADAFHKLIVASLNSSSLQVFRRDGTPPAERKPRPSLSADSLAFPPQAVGSASAPGTVTLSNAGNAPLGIKRVAASGDFAQTNDCGLFVDPGLACTLSVTYSPQAPGSSVGSLVIETSAENGTKTVALSGDGFVPATASLSPARLTFPDQPVGTVSAAQRVTLTNTGTLSLTLVDIRVSTDFGLSHGCGSVLGGGASCPIDVAFAPTSAGPITGTLAVESSAANGTQTASLEGRGVSRKKKLTAAPQALDFERQPVATTGRGRTITVTSAGEEPVEIAGVELVGDRPDAFLIGQDRCSGTRLSPQATCLIQVALRPPERGAFAAALRIVSDSPDGPTLVPLKGRSGKPGRLIFKDDFESGDLSAWSSVVPEPSAILRLAGIAGATPTISVGFAEQVIGARTLCRTITVVNDGPEPLAIGLLGLGGEQPGAFQIPEDWCSGARLETGTACTFAVTLVPGETGGVSAEAHIPDVAGALRGIVTLTGVGVRREGEP